MTELRTQVNLRLGPDMNMSVALTSFVDADGAEEAGTLDAALMRTYVKYFGAAWDAITEETE